MTTCRQGCGACCDPVTIGYSKNEARLLYSQGRLSDEQYEWVENVLEFMPPKEAKRIAPWLFKGRFRNTVDPDGGILTFYYRCTWFDRETRECTHYDERPSVCRDYPWIYGVPDPRMGIPPMCSFRIDVGQVPEDIPVSFTTKPA